MKGKKLLLPAVSCLLLLALLCSGSFLLIRRMTSVLYSQAETTLAEATRQEAEFVRQVFEDDFSLVRSVAASFEQPNFAEQTDIPEYLNSFVNNERYIRLTFCDGSAEAITSDNHAFNVADEDVFVTCMRGEDYFSVHWDKGMDESIVNFGVPLRKGGRPAGYVSVTMQVSRQDEEFDLTFLEGQGSLCVVNREGGILLRAKESDAFPLSNALSILEDGAREKVAGAVEAGATGVVRTRIDGVEQLLGFAPVGGEGGWYILALVPHAIVSAPSQQIARFSLLFCLVISLLLTTAFWVVLSMRKRSGRRIEQLAFRDPVTGGNNWNGFVREGDAVLARSRREDYALIVTDIDQFKFINDRFGYQEGNEVLRHITRTIERHLGERELCARYNSDNFVLLLRGWEERHLLERLVPLWEEISSYRGAGIARYQISLSSGIYHLDGEDLNTAYDRASLALRTVKGRHGNSYAFFDERMRSASLHEREIENEMHSALREGQFVVFLQPKFQLSDETLVGAEALVRWNHPDKGMVPPDEFVPLFERNGFIVEIDLFVIDTVCRRMRKWLDSGKRPKPVSVNISRVHLHNPHFVEQLNNILSTYSIPPRLIELELTESIFFENITIMLGIMERLRKIGFILSMDDFGSGYSSLNLLKAIPVDVLKIDKEFLAASPDDARSRKIVSGVIAIARDLGIKVLSEGVETAEQAAFLKNAHCDYVQGYYFSKPLSIEEFERFVPSGRIAWE